MIDIRWAYLFLDTPRADAESAWRFWADVTGSTLAPVRGENGQFSTLLPPVGQPWIKLQATGDAAPKMHLDLDVDDPSAAAATAIELGASLLEVAYDTVHIMRSPAGFVFCFTEFGREDDRADGVGVANDEHGPQRRAGVHIGQLCLDIPADRFDEEVAFWSRLSGWSVRSNIEFSGLRVPERFPFWMLFQRLGVDDHRSTVTAHPDVIVSGDRADVVDRHVSIGATAGADCGEWTVMADPAGLAYCVCDPPG